MEIACPYCERPIPLKRGSAKPGRYSPSCPGCQRKFVLTVPEDDEQPVRVTPIKERSDKPRAAASHAGSDATLPGHGGGPVSAPAATNATLAGGDDATLAGTGATPSGTASSKADATRALDDATTMAGGAASSPAPSPASGDDDATMAGASQSPPGGSDATIASAPRHRDSRPGKPIPKPSEPTARAQPDAASRGRGGAGEVADEAVDEEAARIGRLGGYALIRQLGKGGMGSVYLARQISLDRPVAVKTMNEQWAADPLFVSRFTREAYAAAQLVHHNVVQIYDIGEDRRINYFSMEFVEGKSLKDLIEQQEVLDCEEAVGYILQAARGLKFSHGQGMIHRDIKPDNLMLNRDGVVKVADLGLVKTPRAVEEEEPAARDAARRVDTPRSTSPSLTAAPDDSRMATSSSRFRRSAISSQASAQVTTVGVAMGTPAYMPPEQADNAAGVDARADVYSLGCTLYHMIAGRPPYEGKGVDELLNKHRNETPPAPEQFNKRVPATLSGIVLKMIEKDPVDRHQSMDEVITDLEHFLGVESSGPFTPKQEHAEELEAAVAEFHGAPLARLQGRLLPGFWAAAAALIVVCLLLTLFAAAAFIGVAAITTGLAYVILQGLLDRTYLFSRIRQYVFGASFGDWAMTVVALALLGAVLYVSGWHWLALGGAGLGAVLGLAMWVLDRRVQAQRRPAVDRAQRLLRTMRLRGLDEDALRQFVCRYAGKHWEAFYEALFGYEAKLAARDRWGRGEGGKPRPTHAKWRDAVIRWIDARQHRREELKQQKHLARVEKQALQAQGKSEKEAEQGGEAAAQSLVAIAEDLRRQSLEQTIAAARAAAAEVTLASEAQAKAARKTDRKAKRRGRADRDDDTRIPTAVAVDDQEAVPASPAGQPDIRRMLRERLDDGRQDQRARQRERSGMGPLGLILGGRTRFILGALLIGAHLLWMHQNDLLTREQLQATVDATTTAVQEGELASAEDVLQTGETTGLRLPGLPENIGDRFFNSWNPGVAGAVLLISSPFSGFLLSLVVLAGAALILGGHVLGIPDLTIPVVDYTIRREFSGMVIGLAATFAALLLLRRRRVRLDDEDEGDDEAGQPA